MMNAREVDMNERMLITKMEYSVLNEVLKYHEWMVLGSSKTIARSCVVSSNNRGKVLCASLWTKMRTMCGSRTGRWSLPCVMSD
jgi:hypothetical protein